MAKSYYIYSTLSNDQAYTTWEPISELKKMEASARVAQKIVRIAGKANIATKALVTPRGVVTQVTDEEYEHLKMNDVFQLHTRNGHIMVEEKKFEPEVVVAKGMKQADSSSPITPNNYQSVMASVENAPVIQQRG